MHHSGAIPIPTAIIHNNRFVRDGLVLLLENEPFFAPVHTYASFEEAFADPRFHRVRLVLIGNGLSGLNNPESIRQLIRYHPNMQVVLCAAREESPDILEAIRAGAVGFVIQKSAPEKTRKVLRTILQGGSPLNPSLARTILLQASQPSFRLRMSAFQQRILQHAARGDSDRTMASVLNCTTTHIFREIRNIYQQIHRASAQHKSP